VGESVGDDVFGWAERDPGRVTFAEQAGGGWRPVTAEQFAARVAAVAAGLIAGGIRPGDRVGLMAATSLDWVICDFAVWAAGAVTVPVYETSSVEQIGWILGDSGAVAAFAGNARQAEAIELAQVANLEAVRVLDGGGLDALARAGSGVTAGRVLRRRRAVTAETLATIVYTSGTTGRPRGCMISHGNLTEAIRAILAVPGVRDRVLGGDACSLFFLPLSHILARVVSLCLVHAGKRVGYLPDTGQLPAALAAFRPTIVLGVPRVFDKLVSAARQQAGAGRRQRLFAAAEAAAIACSRAASRPRPALRLRHAVFARAVYLRGGAAARLIVAERVRRGPGCARGGGVVTLAGMPEDNGLGRDVVRPGRARSGRWARAGPAELPGPGSALDGEGAVT